MSSNFIKQLLDAISGPYALLGILVAFVVLELAQSSRSLAWLLFSLCCFVSSLGRMEDEWNGRAPSLVFPLEQLRALGRPLTIMMLALILVLGLLKRGGWSRVSISQPVVYLVALHSIIFLKTMISGNMGFAYMGVATFGAVVLMVLLGPDRWLRDEGNGYLAVRSLAMVSVIFVLLSGYQAMHDVGAITFPFGRLIGTTDNAQHAAVALALTVPCFMFLIERRKTLDVGKVSWLAGLVSVLIALVLTGSRTGALMAIVSILMFFRHRLGKLFQFVMGAGIIAVFVVPYLLRYLGITDFNAGDIYLLRGNTRSDSWEGMWASFTAYPFFGAPITGGRASYAENSWLAVASVLGLSGLIPMLLFGYECVKMMFQLTAQSRSHPDHALQVSAVIAGLTSLLMGSLLEAFLLGSLTFPLFALLLYLSLGKYLVDTMSAKVREVSLPVKPLPLWNQIHNTPVRRDGPVKRSIVIR